MTRISSNKSTTLVATRRAIREEIEQFEQLYMEAGRVGSISSSRGFIKSGVAAFYVLCTKKYGTDKADDFTTPLLSGAGLHDGDPRLALSILIMGPSRPRTGVATLATIIRAWNAYARGEPRKMIKNWMPGQQYPTFDDDKKEANTTD